MAKIKIEIHKRNIEARLASLQDWNVPEEVKTTILEFLNDLELGKVNRGRRISKSRQLKYLDMLKNPLKEIGTYHLESMKNSRGDFPSKTIDYLVRKMLEKLPKILHS